MDSNYSSFVYYPTETKRWADYYDDDLLPIIPWAPHVKQIPNKSDSKSSEWTTVKSKKKHK